MRLGTQTHASLRSGVLRMSTRGNKLSSRQGLRGCLENDTEKGAGDALSQIYGQHME